MISDFVITEAMLNYFIRKVNGKSRMFPPRVVISVPSGITAVEKHAVYESAAKAGARQTFLIAEPVAAAIGAGLPFTEATASMIVDIGGGTTEVAIMSLGDIATCESIRVAGDDMDEAIINHMKRTYNMMIGEQTAERVKIEIGSASPLEREAAMEVRGRDMISGLPRKTVVTSDEIREALQEPVQAIIEAITRTLERAEPELAADLVDNGIVMAGGGSLLRGLPEMVQKATGLATGLADDPLTCVARGTSTFLENFDEWKDTDAAETLTFFLDAVMSEFIEKSDSAPGLQRANTFARRHRALGVGVLGWHSYLQENMVPIGSRDAAMRNRQVFKHIRNATYSASAELAQRYGEPELLDGFGRRNSTLIAIAPTTSSSFILGQVSQSIEPLRSNYYVKDLAKSVTTYRNPRLQRVLAERGHDTPSVWRSILEHDGSVRHLDVLDDDERKVFATFAEVSQLDLVIQAAQRQEFIDQSQSLNLMVHPATPTKDLNALHLEAWERGVKTLYYQHSLNAAQEFNRELLTCTACEA